VIALDTSVVLAALAPWHTAHLVARDLLRGEPEHRMVVHVAYETTSTLSRMPEGKRIAAPIVQQALETLFPGDWLQLDAADARRSLSAAVDRGIRGGALYDAVIAATALSHGVRLLSFDRRAFVTYEAVGVDAELVAA
jgi:predicted nucleic acid-binding protein